MKIFPERLPLLVREDPKRSAECKVYDALCKLPDGYTVFYSVAWQIRDYKKGVKDGEADFVIVHPDLGIMVLEVKGGRIHYDAPSMQWYSLDRNGTDIPIKDPVFQARNSGGALRAKLEELPDWDRTYRIPIGYMVVFPDVSAEQRVFRPDLDRQIIIDSSDLESIQESIERGYSWNLGEGRKQGLLGNARLHIIENLLTCSFSLRTTLGVALADEESQLVELTENQMQVLRFIQGHRRALIEGCAGSGKTMLAIEKARMLASQGFKVLLLCFNAPLADFLQKRTAEGVEVFYYHGLCKSLAKEARIGYRTSANEDEYYNKILPDMLLEAVIERGGQYDAIIVDEGQDFQETWWETLFSMLYDQETGIFYVFFDSNQNIYHRHKALEQFIDVAPFTLTENCRNTIAIHQVVKEFHQASETLTCRGPRGRAPTISYFSSPSEQEELVKKAIQYLVQEEKIKPERIVLLTTRAPENAGFPPNKRMNNLTLVEWSDRIQGDVGIRVSSVHRFKGLESGVVILTGLEDNDPDWLNPILYVACSRARTHLIVIAHERSHPQLKAIFHHK